MKNNHFDRFYSENGGSPYPVKKYMILPKPTHRDFLRHGVVIEGKLSIGGIHLSTTEGKYDESDRLIHFDFFEIDPEINDGETLFRADLIFKQETKICVTFIDEETRRIITRDTFTHFYVKCFPYSAILRSEESEIDRTYFIHFASGRNHFTIVNIYRGLLVTLASGGPECPSTSLVPLPGKQKRVSRDGDYVRATVSKAAFEKYREFWKDRQIKAVLQQSYRCDDGYTYFFFGDEAVVNIHIMAFSLHTTDQDFLDDNDVTNVMFVLGPIHRRCILEYPRKI